MQYMSPDVLQKKLTESHIAWAEQVARVAELEALISPCHSIPLEDFIGPLKPCPFCGSENLFNDDGMAIICRNCDATAPVSGWQFRAPAGAA